MIPTYYTTEQIAEKLQVHPDTIRKAISDKMLTASKPGKDYRITEAAFNDWIDRRTLYAYTKKKPA